MIQELFSSKKFVTALLAVITLIATKFGVPEMEIEEMITIVSPFLAYIGAQGFADIGKERENVRRADRLVRQKQNMPQVSNNTFSRDHTSGYAIDLSKRLDAEILELVRNNLDTVKKHVKIIDKENE